MKKTILSGALTLGLAVGLTGCGGPAKFNVSIQDASVLSMKEKQQVLNNVIKKYYDSHKTDTYIKAENGCIKADYVWNKSNKYNYLNNCFVVGYNQIKRIDNSKCRRPDGVTECKYLSMNAEWYADYITNLQKDLPGLYEDALKATK